MKPSIDKNQSFPLGKLPPEALNRILGNLPTQDARLLVGPGIGLDCAVIDMGATCLVVKSDPITFATDQIGWYAVQVASNDIVTSGAIPRWMTVTLLLPENTTNQKLIDAITAQLAAACREKDITIIGGHTEVTYGIDRPIIMTTMLAEIARDHLVIPSGAAAGDALFLTKGIPIEATAIIANELPERLKGLLTEGELSAAKNYLYSPGISILKDAQIALRSGKITAMHDPTEGGLAGALWELADASQKTLLVDEDSIPVPPLAQKICRHLQINPLAAIASGALLFSASQDDSASILSAFDSEGIICRQIGEVAGGPPEVLSRRPSGNLQLARPSRDEIARLFESP